MTVLQFPPSESFNNLVSLESRYGTYFEEEEEVEEVEIAQRALMQFASAKRLLLMFAPSIRRSPLFFVTAARSEPAKSINESYHRERRERVWVSRESV
jgi:hypothetical protein